MKVSPRAVCRACMSNQSLRSSGGNRHDFSKDVKDKIRLRSGYICNNPHCRKFLYHPTRALGVVSHIVAASPNGPRASRNHQREKKHISSEANAILLCFNCDRTVDTDPNGYTVDLLTSWKTETETHHQSFLDKMYSISQLKGELNSITEKLQQLQSQYQQLHQQAHAQQEEMIRELQIRDQYIHNILASLTGAYNSIP